MNKPVQYLTTRLRYNELEHINFIIIISDSHDEMESRIFTPFKIIMNQKKVTLLSVGYSYGNVPKMVQKLSQVSKMTRFTMIDACDSVTIQVQKIIAALPVYNYVDPLKLKYINDDNETEDIMDIMYSTSNNTVGFFLPVSLNEDRNIVLEFEKRLFDVDIKRKSKSIETTDVKEFAEFVEGHLNTLVQLYTDGNMTTDKMIKDIELLKISIKPPKNVVEGNYSNIPLNAEGANKQHVIEKHNFMFYDTCRLINSKLKELQRLKFGAYNNKINTSVTCDNKQLIYVFIKNLHKKEKEVNVSAIKDLLKPIKEANACSLWFINPL